MSYRTGSKVIIHLDATIVGAFTSADADGCVYVVRDEHGNLHYLPEGAIVGDQRTTEGRPGMALPVEPEKPERIDAAPERRRIGDLYPVADGRARICGHDFPLEPRFVICTRTLHPQRGPHVAHGLDRYAYAWWM